MTEAEREASAAVLKAMAHPIRLGVVELLGEGERSVTELYEALGCSQSVMSNQLRILQSQGLVSSRREGTLKYWSLANRDFLRLFQCLATHIHHVWRLDEPSP